MGRPSLGFGRVVFGLLVVATVGAFFVAQRLKSEPAVVNRVETRKFFSPNGDGRRDTQELSFTLKQADDVTVDVLDGDGERVARLASAQPAVRFRPLRLTWDGRTDSGSRAPDGRYRVRIGLRRQGRSVVDPGSFTLDTRPPTPAAIVTTPPIVAPGDGVGFRVRGMGPRALPRFQVIRTDVDEPEPVRSFDGRKGQRTASWDGRTDGGVAAPPGTYVIAVTTQDRAGNEGTGPQLAADGARPARVGGRPGVTVRAIAVQPPVRPVRAGELVSFAVDARKQSYRWSVRRVGAPRPVKRSDARKTKPTLTFRAPRGVSGVYLLEVRAGRYSTTVPFAIQSAVRARVLVVLPVITWLGRDTLDTDRDGFPNSLANGSSVPFPRPYVGAGGLPVSFARRVAPLLVTLDRMRVRYDLTTDLALSESRDPRATDRPGVLFAGSPEWVTRGLAKRLRRYVTEGGRVAVFGERALRAGVTLTRTRLTRPTQPADQDALGARLSDLRRVPADPPPLLTPVAEDPELGLLTGVDDRLEGFTSFEELVSPGTRAKLLAGLGQEVTEQELLEAEGEGVAPREARASLGATSLGKGIVMRVGLPEWVPRLATGDAEVLQITRNIIDLLRRERPRPRSPLR